MSGSILGNAVKRVEDPRFVRGEGRYLDDFQVVGSSPEILVRLEDGEVTVRPIAGTRRRGHTEEEDQALEAELLADPKELAEHLMLIDLGRNDVGRVAATGTVNVTVSGAAGLLNAWVDFNDNGVWEGSEQIFADQAFQLFQGLGLVTLVHALIMRLGPFLAGFQVHLARLPPGLALDPGHQAVGAEPLIHVELVGLA